MPLSKEGLNKRPAHLMEMQCMIKRIKISNIYCQAGTTLLVADPFIYYDIIYTTHTYKKLTKLVFIRVHIHACETRGFRVLLPRSAESLRPPRQKCSFASI